MKSSMNGMDASSPRESQGEMGNMGCRVVI